jgi:hypothetical protein
MINNSEYILSNKNFNQIETNKFRILIGNTFSVDMMHYIGWLSRYNGNYKKTAPYTVNLNGEIFEHYNPIYYSEIIDNEEFNKSTILILLENEGWLSKDFNEENKYITYVGNIYNRVDDVLYKKWRHNKYWAPYTQEQFKSTIFLVNMLCDRFKIPKNVVSSNTKITNPHSHEGILYKGNLNTNFTDVNPSWDFLNFKEEIEKNKI